MPRYDVTVRVRTGWPVSASSVHEMRRVGRRLPAALRLRSILISVEGDTELVLRTRGPTPSTAIDQARLTIPMLGHDRSALRRIDVRPAYRIDIRGPARGVEVRRTRPRRRRTILATWTPPAPARQVPPDPPGTGRPIPPAGSAEHRDFAA